MEKRVVMERRVVMTEQSNNIEKSKILIVDDKEENLIAMELTILE
ncbi:MAG: hypothetical protein ACI8RA_002028, partial [Chlamydiales bacterium]